jgi:hypothetical protein
MIILKFDQKNEIIYIKKINCKIKSPLINCRPAYWTICFYSKPAFNTFLMKIMEA